MADDPTQEQKQQQQPQDQQGMNWGSLATSLMSGLLPAAVGLAAGGRNRGLYGALGMAEGVAGYEHEKDKVAKDQRDFQFKQQQEDLKRLENFPKVLEVGSYLTQNLGEDELKKITPEYHQMLKKAGYNVSEDGVKSLMSQNGSLDYLSRAYGDIVKGLPTQDRLRVAKILRDHPEQGQKLLGEYAFAQAQQLQAQGQPIPPGMAVHLGDEQKLSLGLDTKAIMEKKREKELGLGATTSAALAVAAAGGDEKSKQALELLRTQRPTEGNTQRDIFAQALGFPSFAELQKKDPKKAAEIEAQREQRMVQTGTPLQQGVTGPAALEGVDPGIASIAKKVANYEVPLPSGFALRSPYWQKVLETATAYDPSFDASQYPTRLAVKKSFYAGKDKDNITSINTLVGHLDTLKKESEKLGNRPAQFWNTIANYGLTQSGDPRVTNFNTAANAVASELARVFKGTGATDQEIKEWRNTINSSESPKQLQGAVDKAVELMGSRLDAIQSRWETGMGKPRDFSILDKKSRTILKKIGIDADQLDPVGAPQEKAAPKPQQQAAEPPQGYMTIRNPKTKETVHYPVGETPEGWSRIK